MNNRELIDVALFTLLQGASNFTTTERVLRPWNKVPAADMPYMCLTSGNPVGQRQSVNLPMKWQIYRDVWVYAHKNSGDIPATQINNILDRIEAVLTPGPGPGNVITLGQRNVVFCGIEGTVETSEGLLGEIEVMVIPIRIEVSGNV